MSARTAVRGLPQVWSLICQPAPSILAETLSRLRGSSRSACGLLAACQPVLRAFTTSPSETPCTVTADGLEFKIRKVAPLIQLQQDLQNAAEVHHSISYEKFQTMMLNRGAARNEHEAKELSMALQRVGIILYEQNRVFLRPGAVLEQSMPDFPRVSDLEAQLKEIYEKLGPFDKIHQEAAVKTRRILGTGCMILFLQLIAFYRLTFYELSWDVMEPIAYLISLFYTFVGYTYFLATRGNVFDLKPFQEASIDYFKGRKLQKKLPELGDIELDDEQYHRLVKVRARYIKRLEVAKMLEKHRSFARLS